MKSELDKPVVAYHLYCVECGDKFAWFVCDPPLTHAEMVDALRRQLNELTLPSHLGHRFSFKSIVVGITKDEFRSWYKDKAGVDPGDF